jgi:hypothetical protein
MQAARGVLLDHEPTPLGAGAIPARLRCNGKLALAAINLKSQDLKFSTCVAMPEGIKTTPPAMAKFRGSPAARLQQILVATVRGENLGTRVSPKVRRS